MASTDTVLSAVTRARLLDEMLAGVKVDGQWSVLLLDTLTTQIISNVCGISDVLDYGISLVENVNVTRQATPHLNGIYFITPSDASVRALISDFTRRGQPQYKAVHVFFSSGAEPRHVAAIRDCAPLLQRLNTLKEVNLEYLLYPDNRSFTTAQDNALTAFFGAGVDSSQEYRADVDTMATRLATVFSTMKEFPVIRYRAALPPGEEYPAGLESRLLAAQRLAVELHERLAELQAAGLLPERETCELIITDRGFDPVAPIIHEWTYQAMAHDLLEDSPELSGKVFAFESQMQGGKAERREAVLDERDSLYADLRHRHFAAASMRISARLDELRRKSRVAPHAGGVRDLDLRTMSRLVQALPQYRDQLAQLGVHVELASQLNRLIDQHRLTEVGKLEQDLVYGDATSKEVIALLSANQMLPAADKLRVLMCYSATHQEKLDETRTAQWQKVARLLSADMATLTNLEYLGVPVMKRRVTGAGLGAMTFGRIKRRRTLRKDREPDEDDQQFSLNRFVPLLAEVVEDAARGRLSQEEYPYVRPPSNPATLTSAGSSSGYGPLGAAAVGGSADLSRSEMSRPGVASFRTVRSAAGQWAKKATGIGIGRGSKDLLDLAGRGGSRIFAFVIGGFTYSELRTAHRLTDRLGRDVVLGGTSVQTPAKFMRQVRALATPAEVGTLEMETLNLGGATSKRRR